MRAAEIIDSSQMQVLSEFDYVDEPRDNIARYYLGITDDEFVIAISGIGGNCTTSYLSVLFFERASYNVLIELLEAVYAGELFETNQSALVREVGKDNIRISILSAMPHTVTRPIEQLFIKNIRSTVLDGRERDGFFVYASIETGKKMLAEMQRIQNQVVK